MTRRVVQSVLWAPMHSLTAPLMLCKRRFLTSWIAFFFVVTIQLYSYVCRCKWKNICCPCVPWLFCFLPVCRLGSEQCSAAWQSQNQSQWPLEQGCALEPRRLLASVRWTPGTDRRPCPPDAMSPLGSVCWMTQRSSLTSRWVANPFLHRHVSRWDFDS